MDMFTAYSLIRELKTNVRRAFVGREETMDLLVVALLAEGHVLLEDVPGIGKTTLAKALAESLDCSFQRIQFTPDLMPSDVTGLNYFNQKLGEFQFRPGPVMAHIVLADEINRATPRTQSSLLEAMGERQVTVDGVTRELPRPFMVLATQNPIEMEGTYPLPEAQLDRFMLRISLGYPERDLEMGIVQRFGTLDPLSDLAPVLSPEQVLGLQGAAKTVRVTDVVLGYLVDVVRATRTHSSSRLGASPRATLAMYRCAQAHALTQGRDFVVPDDIKRLAGPVFAHRLLLKTQSRLAGGNAERLVGEALDCTPVPVEDLAGMPVR
ncbi:MAG: MoxR family ATPase [Firmicutes bacterium]|nr:MoxR family ATPase [Bacillota bacterium]